MVGFPLRARMGHRGLRGPPSDSVKITMPRLNGPPASAMPPVGFRSAANAFLPPALHPPTAGREPDMSAEGSGEMARLCESAALGDLRYRQVGLLEEIARVLNPQPRDITVRGLACGGAEREREVGFAKIAELS